MCCCFFLPEITLSGNNWHVVVPQGLCFITTFGSPPFQQDELLFWDGRHSANTHRNKCIVGDRERMRTLGGSLHGMYKGSA